MEFNALKDWVFLGILTCGVYILWDLKKSMENLNEKIATIIEKTLWHEKAIEEHSERIKLLERAK